MTAAPEMTPRLSDEQLRALADDAFVVLNWAKRNRMTRELQLDQVVRTFEVRLGYRQPEARQS
ncbi:hypothetical protein [Aminobacter aminovorans]|uniref:Uncharacterized protein n=1 Tax=Aminobacter aminovorans TaxID=83263 RepID=A0AAC9AR61_AMIAI|nr:hypothetical protein [Aminobacter aminovorans]AMS41204.1 hypothetical protein AA2016_2276 [Aminobacter aminovorans]MBB3705813.1 hypothetical protein [Aminobacter aminovorans]